mgnify:CR=1 FL=1
MLTGTPNNFHSNNQFAKYQIFHFKDYLKMEISLSNFLIHVALGIPETSDIEVALTATSFVDGDGNSLVSATAAADEATALGIALG